MAIKPKCIIITGRPGSGKSTMSTKLGEMMWMPVISRDRIKEGYVNTFGVKHDQLPPSTNSIVTESFFEISYNYLESNISVIIEAAFQHKIWQPRVAKLLELSFPLLLICDIDAKVAANRHLQRGLRKTQREFFHGDHRVSEFRRTGKIEPPCEYVVPKLNIPTMKVSTIDSYLPSLDEIESWIKTELSQ